MIPANVSKVRRCPVKKIRYRKIYDLVAEIIEHSIGVIKRTRKRRTMPFKEIEKIINVFFPRTEHFGVAKGYYKHVFVIHSDKKKLVLKIGRSNRRITKDWVTYDTLPKRIKNRYFAKIYWSHNLFMLQKFGKKAKVPKTVEVTLRRIGRENGLKDVRKANIMKFGKSFKIVDAERR
jgi:hypothetical protein